MKTYHVSFINNSSAAYMVVAGSREEAKRKACFMLNISYPNGYLRCSNSGIGKQCLGLIK